MNKPILWVAIYVSSCALILTIHELSPTNLAGPGFDILVYLAALVSGGIILTKYLVKSIGAKNVCAFGLVHILGSLAMVVLTLYTLFR